MKLPTLLREPLVHFLVAGAALFVIASALEPADTSGRRLEIGREELLVFMQGRAQVYDADSFAALLDDMPAEERERLVRDTALQEALYREGEALALADADPVVRARVVQQMRQIVMEEAAAGIAVSDAEVQQYFAAHPQDYSTPASASFTHVYFPAGPGGEAQARATLAQLQSRKVGWSQAGEYGERFLYQTNYPDADGRLVASHFGEDFARALFAQPTGQWSGPLRSEHGWHLVLLTDKAAGRTLPFAEVAPRVREDALAEKRQQAAGKALDELLARYEIDVADDLK